VVKIGEHVILDLSVTQSTVRLSSGEAEYAAAVRAVCEGLYLRNVMRFLGLDARLELLTDSTSAIGTCKRLGAGRRLRHVETEYFFLQNLVREGIVRVTKEPGEEQVTDIGTKNLAWTRIKHLLSKLGVRLFTATGLCVVPGAEGTEVGSTTLVKVAKLSVKMKEKVSQYLMKQYEDEESIKTAKVVLMTIMVILGVQFGWLIAMAALGRLRRVMKRWWPCEVCARVDAVSAAGVPGTSASCSRHGKGCFIPRRAAPQGERGGDQGAQGPVPPLPLGTSWELYQTRKGERIHYYRLCPGMNAGSAGAVVVCLHCRARLMRELPEAQ